MARWLHRTGMDHTQIPMANRCSEDWNRMPGSERRRHCGKCAHSVLNLSEKTEIGARLRLAVGKTPCVRFFVEPDGQIRFRRPWWLRAAAALLALLPTPALSAHPPSEGGGVHLCSTSRIAVLVEPPTSAVAVPGLGDKAALTIVLMDEELELTLPGATVTLEDGTSGFSDHDGRVTLTGQRPGARSLTIRRRGFAGVDINRITLRAGFETELRLAIAVDDRNNYVMGGPIGRVTRKMRRRERERASGDADVHVQAEAGRFEQVVVRCEGNEGPRRASLGHGTAHIIGIEEGERCRARFMGGDRPLVITFEAGDGHPDVEIDR